MAIQLYLFTLCMWIFATCRRELCSRFFLRMFTHIKQNQYPNRELNGPGCIIFCQLLSESRISRIDKYFTQANSLCYRTALLRIVHQKLYTPIGQTDKK